MHHTLPDKFSEFCMIFILLTDSFVSFVTNLVPYRTYPYLTEHNLEIFFRHFSHFISLAAFCESSTEAKQPQEEVLESKFDSTTERSPPPNPRGSLEYV